MTSKKLIDIKNRLQREREILAIKAYDLIESGVQIKDPERVEINGELTCGENVEIGTNVIFEGNVILDDQVVIGTNCILKDCSIGQGSLIKPFSSIEGSIVGSYTFIGPYGRIRPESIIGDHVQIGNFVEIKSSIVSSKCRVNHHSFIGNSMLNTNVTIGAGTITCNHDGHNINTITIESGSYIGSNCSLIAPLVINKNSTIAAGSTITKNVPADTLTIARAKQVSIKHWKGPRSLKSSEGSKK